MSQRAKGTYFIQGVPGGQRGGQGCPKGSRGASGSSRKIMVDIMGVPVVKGDAYGVPGGQGGGHGCPLGSGGRVECQGGGLRCLY